MTTLIIISVRNVERRQQGCQNGRPTLKNIVQMSVPACYYPMDTALPADNKNPSAQMQTSIRTDTVRSERTKAEKIKLIEIFD
jgi:hypothetical protein